MDAKHTSGPWKWVGNELEQDGGEYKEVLHTEVSYGQHCYGGCVDMKISEEDKRLIAAAPELLEALKAVVSVADRATDEFDSARAAIAKATGE